MLRPAPVHVAERTLVEHSLLATGMHVFSPSLDTFTADLQRGRGRRCSSRCRACGSSSSRACSREDAAAKLERLLKIPLLGGVVKKKILGALGLDQCRFAAGGGAHAARIARGGTRRLGLPIIGFRYGMTENCGVSHATLPGVPRPAPSACPTRRAEPPRPGQRRDPGEERGLMLGYYKGER